ncbi:blue copper protein-like [Zingiber officinale]|uniref:Phytocyanin domain-containing protein n=1 Tax=Zingiber officinale TaxID=94328 RepID=A0A8J5EUT8_ZINOF|nr:blue copper protein-like [Zingiber officinale]KAG6473898.1 hypothetical protein ZIOFF_067817 [Zingiber officinale]
MTGSSRSSRVVPFSNHAVCYPALFLFVFLAISERNDAYVNYTVGDSLGWYDRLEEPDVNYQKWVAGKNFSLGDFLIFNTDKNHSVVQTYNVTTYKRCDYNDAEADDTAEWSSRQPTAKVSIAVPLVKEGVNYFFSGNYDGRQCRHGQHFKINVTHGRGLPESLKHPAEAPAPGKPDTSAGAGAVPSVPSSFDNPAQAGTAVAESGAEETVARMWIYLGLSFVAVVIG